MSVPTFDRDVRGHGWRACSACPHPTPGSCPSRLHRPLCDHVRSDPEKWGPIVAAMPAETRPPRPLPRGTGRVPRWPQPDGRPRLGFVSTDLGIGGVMAWFEALVAATKDDYQWVGVVSHNPIAHPRHEAWVSSLMPIRHGSSEVPALASACDILIGWGHPRPVDLVPADSGCKLVVVAHGSCEWTRSCLIGSDRAAALVAVSRLSVGMFPESERGRVVVIPNAIRVPEAVAESRAVVRARWGIPSDARVLGYLGRYSHEKRPWLVLEAVRHLPGSWHVVAVGPYADGNGGTALGAALDSEFPGRVHVVGSTDDPYSTLRAFDVCGLPSETEGDAIVAHEAMALRVPLVATPVGALADRPGLYAGLPPDPTPAELAVAAMDAVSDSGRTERAYRFVTEDTGRSFAGFRADWLWVLGKLAPTRARSPVGTKQTIVAVETPGADIDALVACTEAIGTPPNFGRCNACRARGCRVAGREVDLAECRSCLAGAGPPEPGSTPP